MGGRCARIARVASSAVELRWAREEARPARCPGSLAGREALAPAPAPPPLPAPRAARDTIRADVYDYWRARRARLGRPLMRRLMAPTPVNDQNPYNVFRWGPLRGAAGWRLFGGAGAGALPGVGAGAGRAPGQGPRVVPAARAPAGPAPTLAVARPPRLAPQAARAHPPAADAAAAGEQW